MEKDMSLTIIKSQLIQRPSWQALEAHYSKVRELHLRKLFADDPDRGERMKAEAIGIYFDYSKHRIPTKRSGSFYNWLRNLVCELALMPCFSVRKSTSQKNGLFCM